MTRTMLAQTQQGDDYLSVIRDMVADKDSSYPAKNFFIKDQVLYKKCMSSQGERHVICLPDVLVPAVIHFLHVNLGHSSFTVTKRNFEHYYYNRSAARTIKSYVQACLTCALSHKFDIHKGTPETKRSLEPNRPRQYLYCDILPMLQSTGAMSQILFCLDAYSQFVYAIPLRDKKADSVLQGLLSLFASSGWPEAIYMDNETSFRSAGKQLVKILAVEQEKVVEAVISMQAQPAVSTASAPEVETLKARLMLIEARLPSTGSGRLGGHTFQTRADVLLYVENNVPSNAFHLFHDVVTLLESLTTSHVERRDVLQEWYQSTKVGVNEAAARHMASFRLVLPSVFGRVKEGSSLSAKHHLPAIRSFKEWNTYDGVSGVKSYINTGMEDLKYQLRQDIDQGFDLAHHPQARLLAMEMHELSHNLSWKWGVGWTPSFMNWSLPLKHQRKKPGM